MAFGESCPGCDGEEAAAAFKSGMACLRPSRLGVTEPPFCAGDIVDPLAAISTSYMKPRYRLVEQAKIVSTGVARGKRRGQESLKPSVAQKDSASP